MRTAILGFVVLALGYSTTDRLAVADLVNDPYVLNFADGAGSVVFNLPANTDVPEVFDLAYGSWSIGFVDQQLEVTLTINPMTSTGQLQPGVGAGDLDWTPIPGTITGSIRDPESEPSLFDVTVISFEGGISATSSSSLAFLNAGETPSMVMWRWAIEVEHVPEPTSCTLALAALCLAMRRRRWHREKTTWPPKIARQCHPSDKLNSGNDRFFWEATFGNT